MQYTFNEIANCNMCRSAVNHHKILGLRLSRSQGKIPYKKLGIAVTVMQCANCGLIYANPLPIPLKGIQDHYNIEPEKYWDAEYFNLKDNYFEYDIKKFHSLVNIRSGLKALDVGVGIGKFMIALRNAGFDTYGIEPIESFYRIAIEKMRIDLVKLKLSSIEDAQYETNAFDFINMSAVLEHLYDPSDAIKKAIQWLRPSGLLHIETTSSNWLISKIANIYYKVIGTNFCANLSPMHSPYHLYEFCLKSFKENAKYNNYQIVNWEYYICRTFMPNFLDPLFKPVMKMTNTGMQLSIWLRKSSS